MDDRQLAFLARQPSAALQLRESFWGIPKRGLAFILANAIFWQPLLVQAPRVCTKCFRAKVRQGENRRGSGVYGL